MPNGLRERVDYTYFDTLLSPDGADIVQEVNTLFNHTNTGIPWLCNLYTPGMLSGDQSFTLNTMRTSVFFERSLEDPSIYGSVMAGTEVRLYVGDKLQRGGLDLFNPKERPNKWPAFEFVNTCGPIGILPRQPFRAVVEFSPTVAELINRLKGRKFFKVSLDGLLMRDIC